MRSGVRARPPPPANCAPHHQCAPSLPPAGVNVSVQDLLDGALVLGFAAPSLTLDPFARYPRADFRHAQGRLFVELKTPAGAAAHASIHTKEQLLKALAKVIPGMETRKARQLQMAQQQARLIEEMKQQQALRKGQAGGGGGGGGGAGAAAKKGKGKK